MQDERPRTSKEGGAAFVVAVQHLSLPDRVTSALPDRSGTADAALMSPREALVWVAALLGVLVLFAVAVVGMMFAM